MIFFFFFLRVLAAGFFSHRWSPPPPPLPRFKYRPQFFLFSGPPHEGVYNGRRLLFFWKCLFCIDNQWIFIGAFIQPLTDFPDITKTKTKKGFIRHRRRRFSFFFFVKNFHKSVEYANGSWNGTRRTAGDERVPSVGGQCRKKTCVMSFSVLCNLREKEKKTNTQMMFEYELISFRVKHFVVSWWILINLGEAFSRIVQNDLLKGRKGFCTTFKPQTTRNNIFFLYISNKRFSSFE